MVDLVCNEQRAVVAEGNSAGLLEFTGRRAELADPPTRRTNSRRLVGIEELRRVRILAEMQNASRLPQIAQIWKRNRYEEAMSPGSGCGEKKILLVCRIRDPLSDYVTGTEKPTRRVAWAPSNSTPMTFLE